MHLVSTSELGHRPALQLFMTRAVGRTADFASGQAQATVRSEGLELDVGCNLSPSAGTTKSKCDERRNARRESSNLRSPLPGESCHDRAPQLRHGLLLELETDG